MESAVLGWVSQGLQHEVIAMASCCKKGGGQKGNNCHRQTCSGITGITVMRRDSGVVAGADLRHCLPLVNQFFRSSPERHGKLPTLNQRISLRIHHNGKSTGLARHQIGWNSPQMPNALTCCALVSSEVSHRTAAMVSRCRACRAWLAHSGYPLGHVPRSPRTAIDACAMRRMLSHLEAHSAI